MLQDAPNILYRLTQPTKNWRTNAYANMDVQSKNGSKKNGNTEMGYDNQAADTKDTQL